MAVCVNTPFPWYLLLPFVAGFFYALSALFTKRAFREQVGTVRTLFLSNWTMGPLIASLGFLHRGEIPLELAWQPLVCGGIFFCGQVLTFVAIRLGDVSVMTPMMGTKILFVAFGSVLFTGQAVPGSQWVGAVIAAVAIVLLGVGDLHGGRGTLPAMLCAMGSAACYGISDALLSAWAPAFGRFAFLSTMFICLAVLSFGLIPFFQAPLRAIRREAWRWLLPGVLILAVQSSTISLTLALFGNPTAVNIVYSVRGMWSIALVVWLGRSFGLDEHKVGRAVLVQRAAGSVLLTTAIAVVMLRPA